MIYNHQSSESDTLLKIVLGNIITDQHDITINWLSPSINVKLDCNKDIINAVGEQYFYSIMPYKFEVKNTDCFTTISGRLNSDIMLNCVLPEIPSKYNDLFFKASLCIKEYKTENICRYVSLNLPEGKCYKEVIEFIKSYFLDLDLREIRIFVTNKKDFNGLKAILESKFSTIKHKILKKWQQIMSTSLQIISKS